MSTPPQFGARIRPRQERELLDTFEAARFLSISPDTLRGWRSRRHLCGPRYIKVHMHAVRYRRSDLDVFINARAVQPARRKGEST